MCNLTLSNFNNRDDDLLYLGRLRLAYPISESKIVLCKGAPHAAYNVKIQYCVRGVVPTLSVKAFDSLTMEILSLTTTNQRHIKSLIRICNQHSDRMIINQLQSLLGLRSSKLTVGRSLFMNFDRRRLKNKNLDQQFVNMLVCNEQLLQRFVTNSDAAAHAMVNNGVKQFKGILRGLPGLQEDQERARTWLVNLNQYDLHVETLLYYNPMAMIHGNRQLQPALVVQQALRPFQEKNLPMKSFDKVKVWKINMLELATGQSRHILLSLDDLLTYFESELPLIYDLENPVGLPNLLQLLGVYLGSIVVQRAMLGPILLWKLPLYRRRINPATGNLVPLDPNELYRMKVLDIYSQMVKNIEEQQAFEDNNALPLSLDQQKRAPDKTRLQPPNLCLRCKTIREKTLPIHENNSKQLLKLVAEDTQVVVQRPKVFHNSFKTLQFVLVSVILHQSLEMWIWQLYFPKT